MDNDQTNDINFSSCVKCGKCQTVCPIFSVRPEESSAARGKMALAEAVQQGHLDESGVYRDYLETCLLCGACEEHCPNEVKTLSTMLDARQRLADNNGTKAVKKMILKQVVGTPRLLDLAMRIGRSFLGLVFKRIPAESGIRRRIPLPLITRDRTLPDLSSEFLTDLYSGKVVEGKGPRVGIFAGCMTNYFYPRTGEAIIRILEGLGASVFVPEEQVCCGMPALTGGERETVMELAVRNFNAFEKYELDAIVTGCASCGGNLKENYGELLRDAGIEEQRIERFLSGIFDINEFIRRSGHGLGGDTGKVQCKSGEETIKVTYHHPCHLIRVQGVSSEPVSIIESLPGVKYIPLADGDRCCGMGGSFSLEHYDLSKKVNDQKVARILETGADIVATSCPACIMHIKDGLIRNGREDVEVLHITELITRCQDAKSTGFSEDGRETAEGEELPDSSGLRVNVSG